MSFTDDYSLRQQEMNRAYEDAWKNASPEFLKQAEQLGLTASTESESHATEFIDNASGFTEDMRSLDTVVDEIIEQLGNRHAAIIEKTFELLKKPMLNEIERGRSLLLGRVLMTLVMCKDNLNLMARIHQLLHAIPGLAEACGFPSLRASAKECDVSPEWMRKGRLWWCQELDLPVPAESSKSDEAREKYRAHATTKHWRKAAFKPTTQPNPCSQQSPQTALSH